MRQRTGGRRREQGVMLLEAMIAILIFSIGILGLVAMQGLAISTVSDAKYRSDASFYADQIMSQIWVDRGNLGNYVYPGGAAAALQTTPGSWISNVNAGLPAGNAVISIPPAGYPCVTPVDNLASFPPTPPAPHTPGCTVGVTITWQQPGNPNVRKYSTQAYVSNPQ